MKNRFDIKSGTASPTAVNYQPQKSYILKSDDALYKIRSVCSSTYYASVVFLICSDETRTWKSPMEKGYTTGEMDASIVCTHMMLEAWELGIGSVWVRLFDSREVAKVFNLLNHVKPICLLPVGYASDDCEPYAPWHDVYKNIDEFCEEL